MNWGRRAKKRPILQSPSQLLHVEVCHIDPERFKSLPNKTFQVKTLLRRILLNFCQPTIFLMHLKCKAFCISLQLQNFPLLVLKRKPFLTQLAITQVDKKAPKQKTSISMVKVPDKTEQQYPVNSQRISHLKEQTNIPSMLEKLKSSLQHLCNAAEPLNLFLPKTTT